MVIAKKVQQQLARASWIRKMFEEGAALKAQYGEENVFDFSLGNPVLEPPPQVQERLQSLVTHPEPGMHRYMPNAGYPETRAAVARYLADAEGLPFTREHIVMVCGAGGGLNVVLKALLDPGDEVIILRPYFVEYLFYIDNHGGVSRIVDTDAQFRPDLDQIASAITGKTKALLLNSPHNPTGVVYDAETLTALGTLLRQKEAEIQHPLYLISDEPYRRILYDGRTFASIFAAYERSIAVTSHSKDLALPGERIGYIAVSPQMPEASLVVDALTFANRILGFVNAPALMQRVITGLQQVSIDVQWYQRKRDLLFDSLTKMGYSMVKPEGAFYMFPQSPVPDELEFVRALQQEHILTVPGRGFGQEGYFRIAYCVEDRTIENALPGFERVAKRYGLC
ncbi:MAG: pyridoxal phosphate-dependent aminotransferase [Nitrospinota bacterium]|nr:MAG: pyridoxal phosphate-dependent aminotransferase [Nitrospinota bacterium]